MTIKNITQHLETIAPRVYQESYDNAGLIVGDANAECTGVLTCLDSTEAVIEEAIAKKCNLVVAHHPIVFKGLKRITGKTYIERVILKAIKNDIAIYAIHTNLDNVYQNGVNTKIAERLGLVDYQILAPKANLKQLTLYCPIENTDAIKAAFLDLNIGLQPPQQGVQFATLGSTSISKESSVPKIALTAVYSQSQEGGIRQITAAFPEVDYTTHSIDNQNKTIGSGMIGSLPKALSEKQFLSHLKQSMNVGCIKYTSLLNRKVKKVAVCGGAGGFLLGNAIAAKADFFITSDYKYHEFFDADGQIVIADIGHFESEQFTIDLLSEIIREKFGNFAVHCTTVITNPVQYF